MEDARVAERSLLRTWVMRGTIHLVPTEDVDWLASIYGERLAAWSERRLEILGIPSRMRDRGVAAARKALEAGGPLPRSEVLAAAGAAGFEVNVQTRTHLPFLLCAKGVACIGPDAGRETMLVATRDWIGERKRVPRLESLVELARRYFKAFAPATERDFAYWAGIPLGDARAGVDGASESLDSLRLGRTEYVVPRGFVARVARSPVIRMLGAFDTYLMGYASRGHAVDASEERVILPGGGVLRPTVCVDGRFVAVWSQKRAGRKISVSLEPFPGFDEAWLPGITAEVADIGRFENAEAVLR